MGIFLAGILLALMVHPAPAAAPLAPGAGGEQVFALQGRPGYSAAFGGSRTWEGPIELAGKKYQLTLLGSPLRMPSPTENQLTPQRRERNDALSGGTLLLWPLEDQMQYQKLKDSRFFDQGYDRELPKRLFLNGHQYDMSYDFPGAKGSSEPRVTFKEVAAGELADVKIEGRLINQLVLRGPEGWAILFAPGPLARVPVGSYPRQDVYLVDPKLATPLVAQCQRILNADKTRRAALRVGGPLDNSVDVKRSGDMVTLNYKLCGVGGEVYTLGNTNPGRTTPPEFTITHGAKRLRSGKFEYG